MTLRNNIIFYKRQLLHKSKSYCICFENININTAATMELDPIQTQLKNGKCSVYNRTTAFPLVASAMHIDELCATQHILLPHGLNATE